MSVPPLVSFITFNRAGLVARNLDALLKTSEDFELYIVDNGSIDDTWKYIETLKDERIKGKKRFDVNRGCIYAVNYVLSHRKKDQFFVHMDSDVCMTEDKWYQSFMEAFRIFPELGLVGATTIARLQGSEEKHPLTTRDGLSVYKVIGLIGCCICIRPEVFELLGYYCEETCGADQDMCKRIRLYTPYEMAALPSLHIDQTQRIACENCIMRDLCSYKANAECITLCARRYSHPTFYKDMAMAKLEKYFQEIKEGIRTPYCASVHDEESMRNYYYDQAAAEENFNFFIQRT